MLTRNVSGEVVQNIITNEIRVKAMWKLFLIKFKIIQQTKC